jgi:integrase
MLCDYKHIMLCKYKHIVSYEYKRILLVEEQSLLYQQRTRTRTIEWNVKNRPSETPRLGKGGRRMGRLLYWTAVAGQDKRAQKSFSLGDLTGLSDEAIEKKRKAAIAELGVYHPAIENVPSPDSFAERAQDWLTNELPKIRRHKAHSRYIVRRLLAAFGTTPAALITEQVVNNWIGTVRKDDGSKPSKSTLKHFVSHLKLIVPELKGADIKYPVDCAPEEEVYCPTDEEVSRLLASAKGAFRVLVLLLVMSGMRISEALGLQVEDINFEHCVLSIRRGAVDGKIGGPKTRNARRFITVHRSLIDAIAAHLKGRTTGCLFRSRKGTPLRHSNLYKRYWKPMRKAAGLESKTAEGIFGFHSLRHYSVSYCIRNGMPFDDVRMRHGHGSEKIMKHYTHLAPGYDRRVLAHVPNPTAPPVVTSDVTMGATKNAA